MSMMRLVLARIWAVLLLVALAWPALGPLMDHHFAERQPGHRHLGMPHYHLHTYDGPHAHLHTPQRSSDQPTALYNYESGSVATVAVVTTDMAMQSFRGFEPTSVLLLPTPPEPQAKHNYTAPSKKPPQSLL